MTDYGKGGPLGMATALPLTSAAGYILADHTHRSIIAGFVAVSLVSFLIVVSYFVRYLASIRK